MRDDSLSLEDILEALGTLPAEIEGDGPVTIRRAVPLSASGARDSLTFSTRSGSDIRDRILDNKSAVAIVPLAFAASVPGTVLVRVADPRLAMARVLGALRPDSSVTLPPGVHPAAVLGEAVVGEDVRIAAGAVVTGAAILGDRVRIHENATVGTTGFGYVRSETGTLEHFPHQGTAVLEDDVEVFAHANVDRAALGETRVGRGTKIDHYAHVGHNCRVGEDVLICARAVLAGGVRIGDRCFIGVGASIREKVEIGEDVTVGMGAVVLRNVAPGQTVVGVPARPV